MFGIDMQAYALFLASFALSLFSAFALWTVGRTSPSFKGVDWLSAAYTAGAVASALRLLHGRVPDEVLLYASNLLVLLVYVLLHCALLRVLRPGGSRPWVGIAALVVQAIAGPFLMHGPHANEGRVLVISLLLAATLMHICFVVLRQGLPDRGRAPSDGMRASTHSMVIVIALNIAFSLLRGAAIGLRDVPFGSASAQVLGILNMVVTIVCAVSILLSFLWMTAERLQRDLEIQARLDGLTGLLNRRALEQEFERETERSARTGDALSILLLDLDHFKFINDLYGHQAGDLLLCEVAQTMQQTLRRVDLVARIGGEEFVALLPQTSQQEAEAIAERLRQDIQSREVPFGVSNLHVTASMGVAMWNGDTEGWEDLLRRADAGMYQAKGSGRNRVEVFAT